MMDIFLHLLVNDGHLSYIKAIPKTTSISKPKSYLELWLASVRSRKDGKVKNEHEFAMKLP
jgi:hypothetical protein